MNNMRLSGDMCDVRLIVGDKCVSAHKIVLAATSPYFHAMFTSKFAQKLAKTKNYSIFMMPLAFVRWKAMQIT